VAEPGGGLTEPPGTAPRGQLGPVLVAGLPRSLSLLGFVLMGAVDVAMVAPLGSRSLGALALATAYSATLSILAIHVLAPVDLMIARALGSGDRAALARIHRSSLVLALCAALPVTALHLWAGPGLGLLAGEGDAALLAEAAAYCRALAWGVPAFFLFHAHRLFVEGHGRMWPALVIIAAANLVNLAGNWVLIHGHLGAPALGSAGSAWATASVRMASFLAVTIYLLRVPQLRDSLRGPLSAARGETWRIGRLGISTGVRVAAREVTYAAVIALTARFGQSALAGGQIAFSLLAVANTAQIGFAWGVSVLLARLLGQKDPRGARAALRLALTISAVASAAVALALAALAAPIAHLYTDDPAVAAAATSILRTAALFHVAASFAVTAAAGIFALLDMGFAARVSIPMLFALALPMSWLLAFPLDLGPSALWLGPAAAETLTGAIFLRRFLGRTRVG